MATISIQDLIDINLLGYYDGKIKDWVADQIESSESGAANITITTTENLPETGEEGKLYITEDAILVWDADDTIQ